MKTCNKCGEEKPLSEYHKRSNRPSGVKSYCKACAKKLFAEYRESNIGRISENRKAWYRNNRESELRKADEYRRLHPEKYAHNQLIKYYDLKDRTPYWLTPEHRREMELVYEHARDCKLITGEEYHVDHIVPLRGKNVCGLHVPWNLQVLPSDVNDSKGNKLVEELAIANG